MHRNKKLFHSFGIISDQIKYFGHDKGVSLNLSVLLSGFAVSLGLIAAIGAQNAHVLRQGIAGKQVGVSVAFCIAVDSLLMTAGVFGMATVIDWWPDAERIARWGGAAFLGVYGALCFKSAWTDKALGAEGRAITDFWPALGAIAAVTLLNPHMYLDTLVLVGGIGAQYGEDRASFAVGAVSASWVWFISLGFGARWLRPLFSRPTAWRVLDLGIGALMWTIAASLLL